MSDREGNSLTADEVLDVVYDAVMTEQGTKEHVLDVCRTHLRHFLDTSTDVAFARDSVRESVGTELYRWLRESTPVIGSFWGALLRRAFELISFNDFAEQALKSVEMHVITDESFRANHVLFSREEAKLTLVEMLGQAGSTENIESLVSGDTFTLGEDRVICYFEE